MPAVTMALPWLARVSPSGSDAAVLVGLLEARAHSMHRGVVGAGPVQTSHWASQSSNYRTFGASKGVNGDRNTRFSNGGCTHTNSETNPWWSVDLGSSKSIGTIVLTNRGDCCGNRLNNIEIYIGDISSKTGGTQNPALIGSPFKGQVAQGGRRAYMANGMKGRYVYIRLPGSRKILTLCEVEISEYCPMPCYNLARQSIPTQSSTGWGGYADQGIDGDAEPQYGARSCTHTNTESNPWYKLDLGMSRAVSMVRITNRGDCCTTRLNGFQIRLGDSATSGYSVCNTGDNEKTIGGGQTAAFMCSQLGDKAVTQYVHMYLPGSGKILTLCEVEVFETCTQTCNNVALRKTTYQKDTGWGGSSSRAVDGNTNGNYGARSCSHTLSTGVPEWWYVDLGREYQVANIAIANRKDCCYTGYKNIQITVGNRVGMNARYNPTCRWPKNARSNGITTFPCANNRGRFASVLAWNRIPLVLCEVQVCGFPVPNSALGKNVWMSSTAKGSSPYFAIDGGYSTNIGSSQSAITNKEDQPYIALDLGELRLVSSVFVTIPNNAGMRSILQSKGVVRVSTDPQFSTYLNCGNFSTYDKKAYQYSVVCNSGISVQGRYVEIKLAAAASAQLGITEMEVFTDKPVQCKRSGFQGRRCNTACPAGTGGIACTKCPSAVYGAVRLTGSKMCIRPKGGAQFATDGTQLEYTNQCTDPSAHFAFAGNGAIRHAISGLCIIPSNEGSDTPTPGTALKLSTKCTSRFSVWKYDPVTYKLILDQYWTMCMGPYKTGIPPPNTVLSIAACTPVKGLLAAWQFDTTSVNQWQPVINIQADDSRFYYSSSMWTADTPKYFGSATDLTKNAFLSTYDSTKVYAFSVKMGTKMYNFTLPSDVQGKYSLKELIVQGRLSFDQPMFLGQSNVFALSFTGTARSTYYCGNYGFSQRLFTGVKNDFQCQGIARIGVTTSFKTQYGPVQYWNKRCMSAGSRLPKANALIVTTDKCSTSDATNYFYMTTDNYFMHSSGKCITGKSGAKIGSNLIIAASCTGAVKFTYNFGQRRLTTMDGKLCVTVTGGSTNPGNNVKFWLTNQCTDRKKNYLTWMAPPDSANTPCQRNKPLSAEGIGLSSGCSPSKSLASGNLQGESTASPTKFFAKAQVFVLGVPYCQNSASCNRILGTCDCAAGFYGATCGTPCPTGRFGLGCRQICTCKNGATCLQTNGTCLCKPGFTGSDCSLSCPANTFGPNCAPCTQCASLSSDGCDPISGICSCKPGYGGRTCASTCNDPAGLALYINRWGKGCTNKCRCTKNALCDGVTGTCACTPGWTGATCASSCKAGTWGQNCASKCQCQNKARCNPVDGTCTCVAGWTGTQCSLQCTGTTCGSGCGSTCRCTTNGVCNRQTCGCTGCSDGYRGALCNLPCAKGKYGKNCASTCRCRNGATCNNVDGTCTCAAGWMGTFCGTKCPSDKWGPGCTSTCTCGHGTCNPVNGKCDCDPGYTGASCTAACKDGFFGAGCTQACKCNLNYVDKSAGRICNSISGVCNCLSPYVGACDTVCSNPFVYGNPCGSLGNCTCVKANAVGCNQQHGTCDCKPGYQLPDCSKPCATGRWGQDCNQYCSCNSHGSTCDPASGNCQCDLGWSGHTCSIACPTGTYGAGCASQCSCVQGTCDVKTGACTCNPGYSGVNCDQACASGMFGLLCASSCTCANGTCDQTDGTCTCSDGFTGAACDQQCPPGLFGTGCALKCPSCANSVHATGACNPVDGSCSCSPGYRGALCADTCASGTWGQDCAMSCNCSGSPCNQTTGVCMCNAGSMGATCSQSCPANMYGPNCASICACFNGATCNNMTGTCSCAPGFWGSACHEACPIGHFGAHCTGTCTCAATGTCNAKDGTCVCRDGYVGATCASLKTCSTGFYGPSCNLECQCRNGAMCNANNGSCACGNGYTGIYCEQVCPAGKFGKNCAGQCQCENGDCQSSDGSCVCFAGFMGSTCTASCPVNKWGVGCSNSCACDEGFSCSRTSGACVDTRPQASSDTSSSVNVAAIVAPIVVILLVIGLVIVVVIVRATRKIEKKMPAGMYTADDSDITYGPGSGSVAATAHEHGVTNPTYADPSVSDPAYADPKRGFVQDDE